ncbi:MAG: hypothetical protein AAF902_16835 [Chloroflexota bacterium]
MNLNVSDVKTFVPAKNFQESFDFYTQLGWESKFRADDDGIAILELADCRFYLQNYYQKDWAENFMLHILVEDAQAWFEHASAVIESGKWANARVNAPKEEDYGAIVTYVWDPSGVLLHFAQFVRS